MQVCRCHRPRAGGTVLLQVAGVQVDGTGAGREHVAQAWYGTDSTTQVLAWKQDDHQDPIKERNGSHKITRITILNRLHDSEIDYQNNKPVD